MNVQEIMMSTNYTWFEKFICGGINYVFISNPDIEFFYVCNIFQGMEIDPEDLGSAISHLERDKVFTFWDDKTPDYYLKAVSRGPKYGRN